MNFPKHKCGLYLDHNDHKNIYQSAKDRIEEHERYDHYEWKDEASKQRAIDTDEIWTLQWYPDTPIGFHSMAAPTLNELIEFASE